MDEAQMRALAAYLSSFNDPLNGRRLKWTRYDELEGYTFIQKGTGFITKLRSQRDQLELVVRLMRGERV